MSQIKLLRFRVEFTDATTLDLQVTPVDRMRAERESTTLLLPSQRSPQTSPEAWALLWLWCTATRTGHTVDPFDTWAATVSEYARLTRDGSLVDDDTDPDEVAETVDPTRPAAPTPSLSSSPPATGTPATGSPPTATPA